MLSTPQRRRYDAIPKHNHQDSRRSVLFRLYLTRFTRNSERLWRDRVRRPEVGENATMGEALDVFGYTGDRDFLTKPTRDTVRDAGETFEKARKVYLEAMRNGEPTHKLATLAGEAVGLSRRRIHAWAQQYGWRDLIHTNDRQTGGIDL